MKPELLKLLEAELLALQDLRDTFEKAVGLYDHAFPGRPFLEGPPEQRLGMLLIQLQRDVNVANTGRQKAVTESERRLKDSKDWAQRAEAAETQASSLRNERDFLLEELRHWSLQGPNHGEGKCVQLAPLPVTESGANRDPQCRTCRIQMVAGRALLGHSHRGCFGTIGPGELVECWKCPQCGHSITKG